MAEYISQMKKEIREKTAYFITFNLFLLVFLLSELKILPGDTIQNISLLSGIFAAGFSILSFVGDFYRTLDKKLGKYFKYNVQKISQYIMENLTKPCSGCQFNNKEYEKLKREDFSGVMSLFYTFIPPDHTERERSFAYFTDYYLTLNYLIISVMFSVISTLIVGISWRKGEEISPLAIGILVLYILTSVFSLILCKRYSSRLILPTEAQIREILTTKRDDLISLLPKYRICCYDTNNNCDNTITCAESGRCPLIITDNE